MHFRSAALLLSIPWLVQAAPAPFSKGYNLMTNYVSWAIYGRKYFVTDLPADKLTKVNYAFANVNNSTGEVFLTDEWADLQFQYPGDVATNGTALFGNLKQLFLLKQKHRQLKTFLSIGGWTFGPNFAPGTATAEKRALFASSAVKLVADLGLDGLDVDWEYPANDVEAKNYVLLLKTIRQALDTYSAQHANGYHFQIAVSCPAGPQNYNILDIRGMDQHVDYWNLMAFDYSGSFSNLTGHMSNVYPSKDNPSSTPANTEQAVKHYKKYISCPSKLILGMPLYGRSFANTRGLGKPFNGTGGGTWEAGSWDNKALPLNGSKVFVDKDAIASWSYDKQKGLLISYDTPEIAALKSEYLAKRNLGGAFWWESSSDKSGDQSSVTTVFNTLGGAQALDRCTNWLSYPISKYDNVRTAASKYA